MPLLLPPPDLQAFFASELEPFRHKYLLNGLQRTVRQLDVRELDQELHRFPSAPLQLLASKGLRGELVFPLPTVLRSNPYLLGYYRLLLGYSQKIFYTSQTGLSGFKRMESGGEIPSALDPRIPELCEVFAAPCAYLLESIDEEKLSVDLLKELSLLSVGPQFRGGANNRIGQEAIRQVFELICEFVDGLPSERSEISISLRNAAGRAIEIVLAPDPDIVVQERMGDGRRRHILAIEVKGGSDFSNVHNRLGEAEKSHQKARATGFNECWTIVNVDRLDAELAHRESPTTTRFYNLLELATREGSSFNDFNHRIRALLGIA